MPKKTSKKTSKKKTKISKLKQTHAMVEKDGVVPTTLDQIWGDTGTKKYDTLDIAVYSEWLGERDRSELQTHASKIGLIPIDNMRELKKRLIREFNVHRAKYTKPNDSTEEQVSLDKEVRSILQEGR